MSAIFDLLHGIGQAFTAIVNFVVDMVQDLVWLAQTLTDLAPAIPAFFTWLPPTVGGALYTCIGVAIVLRLLGMGD